MCSAEAGAEADCQADRPLWASLIDVALGLFGSPGRACDETVQRWDVPCEVVPRSRTREQVCVGTMGCSDGVCPGEGTSLRWNVMSRVCEPDVPEQVCGRTE